MDKRNINLIKIGGNLLNKLPLFLKEIKNLHDKGENFVLVHGGGKEINFWMEKFGLEPKFVKGRRVTDEETLKIVEMVLSGEIQGKVLSQMKKENIRAIGINGKSIFYCKKLYIDDIDLGYVGEVINVDLEPINALLEKRYVLVISSIGVDNEGNSYNINADTAALSLGVFLKVNRLIFCTDVPGVMIEEDGKEKVVKSLNVDNALELIKDGKITGGMIPKVESSLFAIKNGVEKVQIWGGDDFSKVWNYEEGTLFYV